MFCRKIIIQHIVFTVKVLREQIMIYNFSENRNNGINKRIKFIIFCIVNIKDVVYNKQKGMLTGVRTGGSCATGCREPCQAGNRAALNGFLPCAAVNSVVRTPVSILFRLQPDFLEPRKD